MIMSGAKAVIECLKEQGVEIIFGYPGGMILPLYDALFDEKDIRQILVTHEQNAAHASAYVWQLPDRELQIWLPALQRLFLIQFPSSR